MSPHNVMRSRKFPYGRAIHPPQKKCDGGLAFLCRPYPERPHSLDVNGSALCLPRELFLMESSNFSHVSVTDLARFCTEETNKFLKQVASNDCFCLELFRRAIVDRNDDAWRSIYQQYAPLVLTWVTQHQSATPILGQEGSAALVNAAFAKFSQALTPAKMENFDSLAAILKYLKMCVHSVVADEVRSRKAQQFEETLEAITQEPASDDPAEDVVSNMAAQNLWQIIEEELHGEDERIVIYQAYVQGMKPGEICARYRPLFPTVDDVYRVKRNVLERLRRSRRLQMLIRH